MLGKLIKHDFKTGASNVAGVYLAAGIAAVTMLIFLLFDFGPGKIVSSLALLAVSVVAIIITFVSIISNFSRSMYGDQGYLTHALPVKSSSLVFSKWLTASFWILVSYCFFYAAAISVYMYLSENSGSDIYDMVMNLLQQMDFVPSGKILRGMVITVGLQGLFRIIALVIFIFFAITLSYVRPFHKLGGIGSVLYFFGVYYIITAIAKGISKLVEVYITFQDSGVGFTFSSDVADIVKQYGGGALGLTETYVKIIASILIFMVTTELVDRKVNIK